MGSLLGSNSSSSSTTSNQAYGTLKNLLTGNINTGNTAISAISSLLNGNTSGLNNYENSAGYQNTMKLGSQAITGNAAASGLLNSGSTLKALSNYGQTTAQQYYNNYLQNQMGLAGLGLQSAGILGSAGSTTNQSGKSKSGLGL
ncbi:hypothetical protein KGP36_02955 [Patescibacteria group bacterium]|nr:hypothetical protein [Patescibacteria group bacterium]